MKKNVMMRIASVLMIAVLLTTCVISGTFAKYTSTKTATSSVSVASWNIQYGGITEDPESHKITFSFFETLKDSDTTNNENDVASGKIIAPGTAGSFSFTVTNSSQVNAEFAIKLEGLGAFEDTIAFSYEIDEATTPLEFDQDKNLLIGETRDMIPVSMGTAKTVTVNWVWAFTDANENSFAGLNLDDTIIATINVDQVD